MHWNGRDRACLVSCVIAVAMATPAGAQVKTFTIAAQPAAEGIASLSRQADIQLLIAARDARGKRTNAVQGTMSVAEALDRLLDGTGLRAKRTGDRTYAVSLIDRSARQDMGQDMGAAVAEGSDNQIPDIVVTARRTNESLQKVPVAVTALTAAALEQKSIRSPADLQYHVPSLQANNGQNFAGAEPTFTMRGLSTTNPGINADASIETYFSEVPMVNTRQIANALYDLQDVQVLRGPQGTLFGKNSDAGAILFTPARPTHELAGMGQLGVGNYGLVRFTGFVNIPVTDTLDLRFSGQASRRSAYTRNISGPGLDDNRFQAGRFQAAWQMTDRLSNRLIVDGYHAAYQTTAQVPINFGPGVGLYEGGVDLFNEEAPFYGYEGAPLTAAQFAALAPIPPSQQLAEQQARGPRTVDSPSGNPVKLNVYTIANTTEFQINDDILLKNIFGYQHQNSVWHLAQGNEPTPVLLNFLNDRLRQTSDEIQLQGKSLGGDLDWIVGGYFADQKEVSFNRNIIYPPVIAEVILSRARTRSKAAFGQFTYHLNGLVDGLDFTAGYRRTSERKSFSSIDSLRFDGTVPQPVCDDPTQTCPIRLAHNFKASNYTIGLNYRASRNVMIYAATRQGFKAGGFNPGSGYEPLVRYPNETLKDVEIGAKTQFDIGAVPVRFNVAAYRGKYGNPLVAPIIAYFDSVSQIIEPVSAGAIIKGVEVEAEVRPLPGFSLSGSYGLTDAKFNNGASFISAFEGTRADPVPIFTTIVDRRVPNSSKHTANLSASYTLPLPDRVGQMDWSLDYSWRSEQILPGFPVARIPAYGLWNGRVDWRKIGGTPFDVALWMKNIGKKLYLVNQQLLADALGVDTNQYGAPRTFGADLTVHW